MEHRILGRTGISVTALGYGALEIRGPHVRGGREITDEQADHILNAALNAGINFIDTSPDYGLSEDYIGRFISSRRSEYFLATKCGCAVTQADGYNRIAHVWTRDNLHRNIEQSLKRMKTDHVDILQLHNPSFDPEQRNEIEEALLEIRRRHHTRYIGVSTTLPPLPEFIEMGIFDTFQIPYSALQREHENWISRVAELGFGTIIRGEVAQGAVADQDSTRIHRHIWQRAGLDAILNGMSRMEFMLRFTLSHPHVNTTIVGTLNPEHLAENVAAANKGPLPPDIYSEAKWRLSDAGEIPADVD